jgi:hypothetical protein
MQNVRNSSVITYIKYLRISIAAPNFLSYYTCKSCENSRFGLDMFNCARTFDLDTMIRRRIKDYIYIFIIDTRCS